MKILIVLKAMEQKKNLVGGVSNANLELKRALEKLGHEVDIFSRNDDLGISSLAKSIFPLRKKIVELVKRKNYDVVYTQDWSLTFPLLFPYRILKNKHLANFCGREETKSIIFQDIVGKIMGEDLSVIGDRLKWAFPKATKIYRGVNFKKFKPLGKRRKYLGWVNKPSESIGKKELDEISKKTGLEIFIASTIPTNELNEKFYSQCKVFISLPPQAGYNNVWNESMAAGVPIVIGNDRGGGTMLPFDKVLKGEDKVEKIIQIIKTPTKINYRKWLMEKGFSWEDKAKELEKFFKKRLEMKN